MEVLAENQKERFYARYVSFCQDSRFPNSSQIFTEIERMRL